MNKVFLLGNVGQDPTTADINGITLMKFSLATTTYRKDKNPITDWHNVELWGKRAETLKDMISKGSRLLVEGKISYSVSEKDGEKKYFTSIMATNIQLLDKRSQTAETGTSNNGEQDDLPF